jgi:rhodanese-related sulfurtransferase
MRPRFLLPTLAAVLVVTALAVAGCSSQEAAAPAETAAPGEAGGYTTVDVQSAHDALSSGGAQIVDVREPEEWAETGVPVGSVLIPLGDLEAQATAELDSGQPVYVICRSGNRSRAGSDILVGLGYTQVYNVGGGVTAWIESGLPVDAYTP